jgi:quercetin dioxygenase-like cupin family protein
MKLHEKIKKIREDLALSIQDVSNKVIKIFGEKKAISYRTIYRVEKGQIAKFASVLQICAGLGVKLPVLLKDTEMEDRLVIRKGEKIDEYTSEGYNYSVLSSPMRHFLTLELIIAPKVKMPVERSPEGNYEKWIYVLKGELTLDLGKEKYLLKEGDSISFKSSVDHQFENNTKTNCVCIVLQNPKHF